MYAAIDVGGTKTLVAVFTATGKIVEQKKFPTPEKYTDFLTKLAETVDKLSTKEFQAGSIAIPGKVDRKQGVGIVFGKLSWTNVPVQQDLEHILNCPMLVENDANLAGLSEALHVREQYKKVLYVTISTGIGGGYVKNGKIDPDFADAEIGHLLLEHDGRLKRWEDFASGSAIVRHFGKKASEITDEREWYVVCRNIAIGLIDLIATLTPEVIIIGGGVGAHFEKYKARLEEQLKIYENPLIEIPPILQAKHAEEAVIYGCFEFARMKYGHDRK